MTEAGSPRSPTCGSSSSACGSRRRRPPRCWPTGAPTSSRSSRPPATRCASVFGSLGIGDECPTRPSPSTTGASAASCSTSAMPTTAQHLEELLADGRRVRHQPPARRPRQARPRAVRDRRAPPAPRVLQRQRLRPAGRGPQPADLRHRRVLGPLGPVRADGRRRRQPAQRPRRHRRPHHRPRRAGGHPRRGDRAAAHRQGPGRRGRRCCGPGPTSSAGTSASR